MGLVSLKLPSETRDMGLKATRESLKGLAVITLSPLRWHGYLAFSSFLLLEGEMDGKNFALCYTILLTILAS